MGLSSNEFFRSFRKCLLSVKMLLILAFICLMAISGFLGYILTSIQAQKSMNTVAELSMLDAANSVSILVKSKIAIGHQLNEMESAYFQIRNKTMDSFVSAYYDWRPLTVQNLLTVKDSYVFTVLAWKPNNLMALNPADGLFVSSDLNSTVCNDTVHFPGSNCSITGEELYPLNPTTFQPIWSTPIAIIPFYNQSDSVYWKTGPMARTGPTWHSTPQDRFSKGYAEIYPTPTFPRFLIIQCNVAVLDSNGNAVGMLGKDLLLVFLGTFLRQLVQGHQLLSHDGRAFVMESKTGLLTGASHGEVSWEKPCETCPYNAQFTRLRPSESSDVIIATAGKEIFQATNNQPIVGTPPKVRFSAKGQSFLHVGMPLTDEYGLAWVVSVVLSLTALFEDIDRAAMQMLGYTALAIISLAIVASLLISYLVTAPLRQLSDEMEEVAEMNLEALSGKRSRFAEIAIIQEYFGTMVKKLKDFRAYLPEAIWRGVTVDAAIIEESPTGDSVSVISETRRLHTARSHQTKQTRSRAGDDLSSDGETIVSGVPARSSGDGTHRYTLAPSSTGGGGGNSARRKHKSMVRQVGSLSRRLVSAIQVDISGFHRFVGDEPTMMAIHAAAIEICFQTVQESGGVCNPFCGDKMLAFWNVRALKSDHTSICVAAALRIRSSVTALKMQDSTPFQLRIACTSGQALCGSLGTTTMRAFSVVSPCIPRGFVVQKLAKLMPATILCDATVHEHAQYHFHCRLLAIMPLGGSGSHSATEKVYEVLKPHEGTPADEWMYELNTQDVGKSKDKDFGLALRSIANYSTQAHTNESQESDSARTKNSTTSGNGLNSSIASTVAVAKQYLQAYLEANPTDQTAVWYLDHLQDVMGLYHPQWGFTLPVNLMCTASKTSNTSPR